MNPSYQINGTLNAFEQFNIARKLSAALPILQSVVREENKDKDRSILIVMGFGMLSDEDSKYITEKCLSLIVRIQEGSKPARIFVNGNLMFQDIALKDITDFITTVIEENLADFLNTALPKLTAE